LEIYLLENFTINAINFAKILRTLRLKKEIMAKYLTGVQSTGTPHLGNLLGAIIPAIALSKTRKRILSFHC
jgi:tryptophanyl-tRNA synthetase